MTLKYAMLKAFEYALDNPSHKYQDVCVYSDAENICFSIFDKDYDFHRLQKFYGDDNHTSFDVFITIRDYI